MSTRYLEFDSTYRDRKMYPLPSNFVVEMSQSGQNVKLAAKDPVSDASPVLYWNNNFVQYDWVSATGTVQTYVTNITASPWPGASPTPSLQGTTVLQLEIVTHDDKNMFKQVKNFYVGSSLSRGITKTFPDAAGVPAITRRILEYTPIDFYNAIVTIDSPLPDTANGDNGFYIMNPTPLETDTTNAVIKFYVPGSNQCVEPTERIQMYGLGGDNYYVNKYVMNTDTGTTRKIISFDALTRLATLDSATPAGEDWVSSSYAGSNFAIRRELPIEYGPTKGILYATPYCVQLEDVTNPPVTNAYAGDFLRINPLQNAPSPYNITASPPYNSAYSVDFSQNCQTEERQIRRYVYGKGTIASISGHVINLGSTASSGTEYVGTIISNLTSATLPPPDYKYSSATIIAYNGVTKEAVTDVVLPGNPGDTWFIRTCVLVSPFSVLPHPENLYEVLPFTKDNSNPFNYTGSIVSSQENVCYEVELLNLVLPNTLLASGRGGRPIFYPYLYVQLEQLSTSSSANRGIIYSNNPNSFRMLFRAVVDDTTATTSSPFIKIDGDGMVHTIKFKPNECFRFAVFHANGEPFVTVLEDQFSPTEPNPLCQISACFAFKRI